MRVLAAVSLLVFLSIGGVGTPVALADPPSGLPIGTWSGAGSLSGQRSFMPAVTLPDGRVLIVGGQGPSGDITTVELFDPSTGTWSVGASLTLSRSAATATVLDDGTVLATGGVTMGSPFRFSTATTEIYQPATDTWTAGPDMSTPRARHTATKLTDGRVLIVGGWGGPDPLHQHSLASAEIYDPASNTFSGVPDMPYYRSEHFATPLTNGKVLIAGGMGTLVDGGLGQNSGANTPSAALFEPTSETWVALPDMGEAHRNGVASGLPDGRVLVAGGEATLFGGPASVKAEAFDPTTNTWSPVASTRWPRDYATAASLADGRVLIQGGYTTDGRNYSISYPSGEIYDPASDSWAAAGDTSSARWDGTMISVGDGTALLIGGYGDVAPYQLATIERFDPDGEAPARPEPPSTVSAVVGDAQATVSWTPPQADGGSPITGYVVTSSVDGQRVDVDATASSASFTGLRNGRPHVFSVAAKNAVGTGAAAVSALVTPTAPPPPDPYVRAVGTHLELEGQTFTFTGMNIYNANSDDWCANNMDNGRFEQALSDIGLGGVHGGDHGVIRAWFFQPLATPDIHGPRDWTRFDRTIAAAKAAGYYVIPTLGNQWGECGHKGATAPYKTIDWYRTGYKQLQPEDTVYANYASYRDWVDEVVDRYKDEPAILAWQLLNEAETNGDQPGGCPAGPAAYDAIAGWASDISGLIKSIDPNHLVSLGTIGTGQCGTSGSQYKDLHAISTIDLCEYHDYDPWAAMPGDAFNGMALRIQQCGDLHKPIFVGEVGLRPNDVGGSYASRVASLRAKLQAQRAAGMVGHVVWSWGPAPRSLSGYDIGPGDQVPELLAAGPTFTTPTTPFDTDWIAPSIWLTSPNRSLYTLNEPLTAAFSCSENGSSGLATCAGTLPNGATVPTTAAGHFTFTVTTTDTIGNQRSTSIAYDVTAGDVTTTVPPGPASVSTDPGNIGASPTVPVQTTVAFTAPSGEPTPVAIDMHAPNIASPSGYAILGNEVDINLGGVTRPAGDPIVITFVVDSSTGANPATITVSRTNVDATTDIALPCDALPAASPDPCYVAAFVAGAGSDVRVTIRTTHASKWLVLKRKDTSPPNITATVTGSQGSGGWYRSNVAVSWSVTDPQSAILTSTGCGPSTISTDTAGTTKTCKATSAGETTTKSVTVKRDATGPTLTCQTASFVLGDSSAKVKATITDALSGPDGSNATASANTSSVGSKAVTVTGKDKAGNATTVSCAYTVTFKLAGLKPATGTTVQRGSTIAIQFRLQDASGREISDAMAKSLASSCAAVILFTAGNPSPNCARYDDKANTFLFDLKTSKTQVPGDQVITVRVTVGGTVINTTSATVRVRT